MSVLVPHDHAVVAAQDVEARHAQQVTVLKDGWAKELKRQREVLPPLCCPAHAATTCVNSRLQS